MGSSQSSSRRSREREWYGQSGQSGHSSSHGSYSKHGHSGQSRHHYVRRDFNEAIAEPFYRFTRDDRKYSFGRRDGREDYARRREPEVQHHGYDAYRADPQRVRHYKRGLVRREPPKRWRGPQPNPFADFDCTTAAGYYADDPNPFKDFDHTTTAGMRDHYLGGLGGAREQSGLHRSNARRYHSEGHPPKEHHSSVHQTGGYSSGGYSSRGHPGGHRTAAEALDAINGMGGRYPRYR